MWLGVSKRGGARARVGTRRPRPTRRGPAEGSHAQAGSRPCLDGTRSLPGSPHRAKPSLPHLFPPPSNHPLHPPCCSPPSPLSSPSPPPSSQPSQRAHPPSQASPPGGPSSSRAAATASPHPTAPTGPGAPAVCRHLLSSWHGSRELTIVCAHLLCRWTGRCRVSPQVITCQSSTFLPSLSWPPRPTPPSLSPFDGSHLGHVSASIDADCTLPSLVDDIQIFPDPPVPGKNLTVIASGLVVERIEVCRHASTRVALPPSSGPVS